jgi:hypothetical protein
VDGGHHFVDGVVDFFLGCEAAEAEADAGVGVFVDLKVAFSKCDRSLTALA